VWLNNASKSYSIIKFILEKGRLKVWWHTPVMPAFRRLRQENCEFEARLGYIATPCLKKYK
jgi:hypothetical protein